MLQGIFFFRTTFWSSKVRHQNGTPSIGQNFHDRRHGSTQTSIVSHLALFIQWHVKINTNKGLFISKRVVVNGLHILKFRRKSIEQIRIPNHFAAARCSRSLIARPSPSFGNVSVRITSTSDLLMYRRARKTFLAASLKSPDSDNICISLAS